MACGRWKCKRMRVAAKQASTKTKQQSTTFFDRREKENGSQVRVKSVRVWVCGCMTKPFGTWSWWKTKTIRNALKSARAKQTWIEIWNHRKRESEKNAVPKRRQRPDTHFPVIVRAYLMFTLKRPKQCQKYQPMWMLANAASSSRTHRYFMQKFIFYYVILSRTSKRSQRADRYIPNLLLSLL